MKLKFLLLAFVALSMFSCGDKDEVLPTAKDIENEYVGGNIVLTNSGNAVDGGAVTIVAVDANNIIVTLTNVVTGHDALEVDAVVSTATRATVYSFAGSKELDGMKVSVTGSILNGVATIDVATAITSEVSNNWGYNVGVDDAADFFDLAYTNGAGTVEWGGEIIPTAEFEANVKVWVQMIMGMTINPINLDFKENGFISGSAVYLHGVTADGSAGPQTLTFENEANYTYSPTDKVLNLGVLGLTIPVPCTVEGGKMVAVISSEFLKPFIPMIPEGEALDAMLASLDTLIPPGLAFFLPIIKTMVKDIVAAVKDESAVFAISLKLQEIQKGV